MFALAIFRRSGINVNYCLGFSSFRHSGRNSFGKQHKVSTGLHSPSRYSNSFQTIGFHTLVKPLAFTVCFSSGVFVCAAIWQYEGMRKKAQVFRNAFDKPFVYRKKGPIRTQLSQWWNSFTEGQKIAYAIIAINVCVFLMWKVPAWHPFLQKYFTSNPASNPRCLPMLLSTFSHYGFMHMAINMYVLQSFATGAVAFFGKEQFVALYLSAGVISSFASYVHKIATKSHGFSLGASGALMAVLSSVCLQFPQTQLAFVFLPFFTISAGNAIKIVMALDFIGLLAKWKYLDHAAHLGGACFGLVYLYFGRDYIWGKRERLIVWWHNLRGKIK